MNENNGRGFCGPGELVVGGPISESRKASRHGPARFVVQVDTFLVMNSIVDSECGSRQHDRQMKYFSHAVQCERAS